MAEVTAAAAPVSAAPPADAATSHRVSRGSSRHDARLAATSKASDRAPAATQTLTALHSPGAEPGSASAWVAAGALSDALDVAASLASWRELPRLTRWLVAASAGGAALTGAAAAVTSATSRPPSASS